MTSGSSPMSRRRFLGLAAAPVAASFATAGCGDNTGRPDGDPGTLVHWYHQYGEEGVREAVERYAASYDRARVRVQWTPGDYATRLLAALQGGAPPDVFEYQTKVDLVRAGLLEPLDDLIADVRDDFSPAALAIHTVDGSVYGIPQAVDTQVLVYRKSLLDDAGTEPPRTWEALADAARTLTRDGRKGLFLGNDAGVSVAGPMMLWSVGLEQVTADRRPGFADPAAASAFERLRDLYEEGTLLLGAPTDWADPAAFVQELTAMQWTGLWALPRIEEAFPGDYGVLPWPRFTEAGADSVPVGAFGAMAAAEGGAADLAKDYIHWLWIERTDLQEDFNLGYGLHIPPRGSIASSARRLASGPAADAVDYVDELGRPSSPPEWTSAMDAAFKDALGNIVKGGAAPREELERAARTVQDELDALFD
ncbi:ABC transporter substrate-binding protein [Marinactinospora thermotolerans]|uniref:Carbohydrate ABC transporter substrate-binding protein, CUT1 family n=1 Tax=Marinactinospora thermotolerans DSM 45154 TaxID=1122192 RepID=A0A1T4R6U2_9ACTN|nr:extracellular solute-binding protein [Marinactinospora thermotolerans]SKA11603.1 carbohydrate ABC transporter substrate-binding protein, CUT1 family [Marinactinospora thermotolerans DSM 45154]